MFSRNRRDQGELTMSCRLGLAFVAFMGLGGCEMTAPSTPPIGTGEEAVPPGPLTPSLKVAADDPGLLDGAGSTQFKLANLRFLQLRLAVPALPQNVSWMTMKVYTPQGALYSTRHLPYATDPEVKEVASPDGVAHPIEVLRPRAIAGGYALDAQILVGGSNMVRRPNPGAWRVTMEVDGAPQLRAETTLDFGMTL